MRPAGRYLTALVGAVVVSFGMDPFAGDQTLVIPVTQERIIEASASASDASSGSSEFEDDQAPDFGPFDSVVSALGSANTAGANSASTQASEITADAIQASGAAGHGIYISAQGGSANASSSSEVFVAFQLMQEATYTLLGSLETTDVAVSHVMLAEAGGVIHEVQAAGWGVVAVDESGTLAPGEYTIEISASAFDGASGFPIFLDATASYDVTLQFAVEPPAGPGGEVPDGADVPGAAPLMLEKLSDGLVRLTWDPSCRPDDDDYAIYGGPIGDIGSLVPVICSTVGQNSHEFEPLLDAAMFLVVPTDGTTEGAYGDSSDGVERLPSAEACLPQVLGAPICP